MSCENKACVFWGFGRCGCAPMAGFGGLWAELQERRGPIQAVAVGCSEFLPEETDDLPAACAGGECAL